MSYDDKYQDDGYDDEEIDDYDDEYDDEDFDDEGFDDEGFDDEGGGFDIPDADEDFEGSFALVEHLIQQGCRRIAACAGPKDLLIKKNS